MWHSKPLRFFDIMTEKFLNSFFAESEDIAETIFMFRKKNFPGLFAMESQKLELRFSRYTACYCGIPTCGCCQHRFHIWFCVFDRILSNYFCLVNSDRTAWFMVADFEHRETWTTEKFVCSELGTKARTKIILQQNNARSESRLSLSAMLNDSRHVTLSLQNQVKHVTKSRGKRTKLIVLMDMW